MLSQRFRLPELGSHLLPLEDWRPFPTVRDREGWSQIPAPLRALLIEAGDARLGYEWPALPATLFLDYARTGARVPFQDPHFERRYALVDLVLAECVQGEGRYLDDIVNGVWAICEETFWGVPAHIRVQRAGNTLPDKNEPTVDLFAAETGALLAWTHYLMADALDTVSPMVRLRIAEEIQERILDVLRRRIDFPWQGNRVPRRVNNWNPWICSNWLTCILAIEPDPLVRAESVFRLLQTLDRFIDSYPADGGCDEGPNYWGRAGASLYDNLELLHGATEGAIDVFEEPLIREIGRFVHRAHIADDYYLNFADASALVVPEAPLVYLFGRRIGDPEMQAFGQWLMDRQRIRTQGLNDGSDVSKKRPSSMGRALPSLFLMVEPEAERGAPPLTRDVWLPEIQVMIARDQAGSKAGFYAAIKGGHNEESHNHNDIGNFVVYLDGLPLLVDAGVEEYTAKTFGPQRYDIWTMQSAYHNLLPTLDGEQQWPGPMFQAGGVERQVSDEAATLRLDLAPAYRQEAGIQSWHRTFTLRRGRGVTIEDEYALARDASVLILSLMTPCDVTAGGSGQLRLEAREFVAGRRSAAGTVEFDPERFQATVETIPIQDQRMEPVWGERLQRIVFTDRSPGRAGNLRFRVGAET